MGGVVGGMLGGEGEGVSVVYFVFLFFVEVYRLVSTIRM